MIIIFLSIIKYVSNNSTKELKIKIKNYFNILNYQEFEK